VTTVLVIAGSDSSGGAGLARDLRTLASLGTSAACALTAVTAQSDEAVSALHVVPADVVRAQIVSALATRAVRAIKIGMLATEATVAAVAASLPPRARVPVVLDPVLAATSGVALLDLPGRMALRERLLERTTVLTPNIPEAAALLDTAPASTAAELLEHGRALLALGPESVLIKGGHAAGAEATDLLLTRTQPPQRLSAPRAARGCRGTGCALATAIAAGLANGLDVPTACARAKQHVTALIQRGG
jgi:hydroxymethylpyrimidine/phosphomethylpyrimidine kinase